MHPSDEELHDALRRESPPAGFEGRVVARARQLDADRPRSTGWRWAAAAVLVIATGSAAYEWQTRLVEGERAKEQLLSAFRVTGEKLRNAHAQVQEIEQREIALPGQ